MMITWPLARGGGKICRHFVNLSLREEGGFLFHTQAEKKIHQREKLTKHDLSWAIKSRWIVLGKMQYFISDRNG